jgi:hypothetical protein
MEKKFVFWSPVDPCVEYFVEHNSSLYDVSDKYPFVFACSNGIDRLVRQNTGRQGLTINTDNNMKGKGTAVFSLLRSMEFDVCIRVDFDAIVFDLPRLISWTASTQPMELVGWQVKESRIRGGCQACGVEIVRNIAALGDGKNFDAAMSKNVVKMGGALRHRKLFEMSTAYTGESPVWHPKKDDKAALFERHIRLWKSQNARVASTDVPSPTLERTISSSAWMHSS